MPRCGGGVSVDGEQQTVQDNLFAGLRQQIFSASTQPDAVRVRRNDPVLVDVLDLGEAEDGEPYMVMELLDGVEPHVAVGSDRDRPAAGDELARGEDPVAQVGLGQRTQHDAGTGGRHHEARAD